MQTTALVIALSQLIVTATAIKCFQCSSYEHPECADLTQNSTDSEFYQECRPDHEDAVSKRLFCRVTVQRITIDPDFNRITRSCGWIPHKSNDSATCRKGDTDFRQEISCQCFSDGCNSATALQSAIVVLLTFSTACFLFV